MDEDWTFSDDEDEAFLEEWRAVDRAAAGYLEERVPGLTDPVSDGESRWLDALVETFDPTDEPDLDPELFSSVMALQHADWLGLALGTLARGAGSSFDASRVIDDIDLLAPWMGKGNREQNMLPVKLLRSTATGLGLLRKRKGELLPTATGQRLAGDPDGMWDHVVSCLPLGRTPVEKHAGAVALLAVASGEEPQDLIRRWGSDLLWSAGWAASGNLPPSDWDVLGYARPTWDALRVASSDHHSLNRKSVPEELRQLARAALRAEPG